MNKSISFWKLFTAVEQKGVCISEEFASFQAIIPLQKEVELHVMVRSTSKVGELTMKLVDSTMRPLYLFEKKQISNPFLAIISYTEDEELWNLIFPTIENFIKIKTEEEKLTALYKEKLKNKL